VNLHIILYQPEIPQNTGNIGRLCAVTESVLHLIHPLGFEVDDRRLKRSGMDYWQALDVRHYDNWIDFRDSREIPSRIWLFTTRSAKSFWTVRFSDGDGLLFGNEGAGCPEWLHKEIGEECRITVPQKNRSLRTLNLSTCVGIATYEAIRQIGPHG